MGRVNCDTGGGAAEGVGLFPVICPGLHRVTDVEGVGVTGLGVVMIGKIIASADRGSGAFGLDTADSSNLSRCM